MGKYKRPSALEPYEPENPRVLWKRRAEYKTPYFVDKKGKKKRNAQGMAQLLARENENEDSNRHVYIVAIDRNLEKDMDSVWQKRLDLVRDHEDAVYVEDRTLDQELWKLIRVTLYDLAKRKPRETEVLRAWPSSVLSRWELVKENRKGGIRWSVGWPGAEAVTGPNGDKRSPYVHSSAENAEDPSEIGMVQGSDNEDEDDDQEAAVAKHRNASISEMLRGKSDVEMHGQYTSVSKPLFRTEFDPALNAFEGTNIFKILLRDRSLSRQERKELDDALQLYFTSVSQIRYGTSSRTSRLG